MKTDLPTSLITVLYDIPFSCSFFMMSNFVETSGTNISVSDHLSIWNKNSLT